MCSFGYCASAEGACIAKGGSRIGRHSLRFGKPFDPIRPYVTSFEVAPPSPYDEHGSEAEASGVTHYLETTSSDEDAWEVALTGEGHVRLESRVDPGHVLSIYHNRRRRTDLLQKSVHAENHKGHYDDNIDDSDDLWPVLVHFRSAHPLDVTFRARRTEQDGGGIELWHPQTGHALAAADPHWLFRDRVAAWGVAECRTPTGAYSGDCAGRQLIDFNPPLPQEATFSAEHEYIREITVLTEAQALLLIVGMCICCALCVFFVP